MAEHSPLESLEKLETALEEEQQRLRSAQDDIAEKITTTRQMLRACAGKMEKHKQELESLSTATRDRLQDMRTQVEQLGDNTAQQEELDNLTQQLTEKEDRITQLNTQLAEVEEKSNAYDEQIKNLETELEKNGEADASHASRIEELENESNALKEKLTEAENRLHTKSDEIPALQQTIDTLRAEQDTLREEATTLKQELESHQAESASQGESVSALEDQLAEQKSALEQAQADHEKALGEKQEELDTLQADLDDRPSPDQITQLEEEVAKLKANLEEAESGRDSLKSTLEEERTQHKQSSLAIQLADALREAEEAKDALAQLQQQGVPSEASAGDSAPAVNNTDDKELIERIKAANEALGSGKRSIGELLIEAEVITESDLEEAIAQQRSNPQQHIGGILIEAGKASDVAVAQALALQCKVPFHHLSELRVESEAIEKINPRLAQQHRCLPYQVEDNIIHLAMANPMDLVAIEDVERAAAMQVEYVVLTESDIATALEKHYA